MFFISADAYCQKTIKVSGTVKDSVANPVFAASIVFKTVADSTTLAFAVSDNEGRYEVLLPADEQVIFFIVRRLGYQPAYLTLPSLSDAKYIQDVILYEEDIEIDEVIVRSKQAVVVKKDTVVFQADAFLRGNEYVLEDLLANLPGVKVEPDGKVLVNGREVKTIKIDNDDLFGKSYKLVSKSLTVEAVEEIEILENYSENQVVSKHKPTEEVALNLKLKEDFKSTWFGKAGVHAGNERHRLQLDPVWLNNSFKLYSTNSSNNVGQYVYEDLFSLQENSITDDLSDAVNIHNTGPADIGEINVASLPEERFHNNNTISNNVNTLFKFGSGVKAKLRVFHIQDKRKLEENRTTHYKADEGIPDLVSVTNSLYKNQSFLSQLILEKSLNDKYFFNVELAYGLGRLQEKQNLRLEEQNSSEGTKDLKSQLSGKFTFSRKLGQRSSLHIVGVSYLDQLSQYYGNSINFWQQEDVNNSEDPVDAGAFQESSPSLSHHNVYAEILSSHGKLTNSVRVGYNYYQQTNANQLTENFSVRNDSAATYLSSFNFTRYSAYLESETSYEYQNFKFNGRGMVADGHYTFEGDREETGTPFGGSLAVRYRITDAVDLFAKYFYGHTFFNTPSFASGLTRINYLLFREQSLLYGLQNRNSLTIGIKKGAFDKRLLFNLFFIWNSYDQELKDSYTYDGQTVYLNSAIVPGSESYTLSSSLDYFLVALSSNLKFTNSLIKVESFSMANEDLFSSSGIFLHQELTLRSAFKGLFNYHFGVDLKVNNIQNPLGDQLNRALFSYIDLSFNFNKNFTGNTAFEVHKPSRQVDRTYFFWDLSLRYHIPAYRSSMFLDFKNVLNNQYYSERSITDLYDVYTQTRIIPFYFLAGYSFNL